MKMRFGFISNSSSTSYIVKFVRQRDIISVIEKCREHSYNMSLIGTDKYLITYNKWDGEFENFLMEFQLEEMSQPPLDLEVGNGPNLEQSS